MKKSIKIIAFLMAIVLLFNAGEVSVYADRTAVVTDTNTKEETVQIEDSKDELTDEEGDSTEADDQEEPIADASLEEEAQEPVQAVAQQDESEEEVSTFSLNQIQSLSNGEQISWLTTALSSTKSGSVDISKKEFTANSGTAFILLSQLSAQIYQDWSITIASTSGQNTIDLSSTIEYDSSTYAFLGLGSDDAPFKGSISMASGSKIPFLIKDVSLFLVLSDQANCGSEGLIFSLAEAGTQQSLLAGKVVHDDSVTSDSVNTWNISIQYETTDNDTSGSDVQYSFGGILDVMESGSMMALDVDISSESKKSAAVEKSSHAGLLCNEMKTGASLRVIGCAGAYSVESDEGDAGALVGHMESGTSLEIQNGFSYSGNVKAKKYAGILFGYGEDVTLTLSGTTNISGASITGEVAAGGISGFYKYTGVNQAAWSEINVSSLALSGFTLAGENTGGLFGVLENAGSIKITGTANSDKKQADISSSLSENATGYGGVIGEYSASTLSAGLLVNSVKIETSQKSGTLTNYGGLIAQISGTSAAYVEISDVDVTTTQNSDATVYGGLVATLSNYGHMLNIGNAAVHTSSNYRISTNGSAGGLIGKMASGVIRLSGITDLSDAVPKSESQSYYGQLVGTRDNVLIYACGTGKDDGWTYKRCKAVKVNDIGNWGEVIRLGDDLKEGENELIRFDAQSHTVTVQAATTQIDSVKAFAALALHIQLNTQNNPSGGALLFLGDQSSVLSQETISLLADINLSGTGILGLQRDDGENQVFTGTFDGNNHTVTLAVGEAYGMRNNTEASGDGSGRIYAYRDASSYQHTYLGLFARTDSGTQIQNLVLDGTILFTLRGESSTGLVDMGTLVANAANGICISNVTVLTKITYGGGTNSSLVSAGALIGEASGTPNIQVTGYTWESALTNASPRSDPYNGGMIGLVASAGGSISVKDSTLSGTISYTGNTGAWYIKAGGLIAEIAKSSASAATKLTIENLDLNGLQVNTRAGNAGTATGAGTGGLFGFHWWNTDVDISGVTLQSCSLTTDNVGFGGLVYQASGYWNVHQTTDGKPGIYFKEKVTFKGKSIDASPSALLVAHGEGRSALGDTAHALYMEIAPDAYKIEKDAVTVTFTNSGAKYFDEIVGTSITSDNAANGVVSIATTNYALIDTAADGCNTYQSQLSNTYDNPYTRYYYNLDNYRAAGTDGKSTLSVTTIDTPQKLLMWSLRVYAASNLKDYFAQNSTDGSTITGNIDLTGYSYYPVDIRSDKITIKDAVITFNNLSISQAEKSAKNKVPDNTNRQHALMQTGLFYNVTKNTDALTVDNLTLQGTAGKTGDGSGALICGTITGSQTQNSLISIQKLSLNGLYLVHKDGSGTYTTTAQQDYAPLLINKISEYVSLAVTDVETTGGYENFNGTTASSLIGQIGKVGTDSNAKNLSLSFNSMKLDSRTESGQVTVYGTRQSIFWKATFADSILADPYTYTGIYNFKAQDNLKEIQNGAYGGNVTYGKELSDSKRNKWVEADKEGGQYWFFDNDQREKNTEYVYDPLNLDKKDKDDAFSNGYLPYVGELQSGNYLELDVNQGTSVTAEGCGTYGDPYLVTSGMFLVRVANYLQSKSSEDGFTLSVDKSVLTNANGSQDYHTYTEKNNYTGHVAITYDALNYQWVDESGAKVCDYKTMQVYFANAYYEIVNNITITKSTFTGLGGYDATSGGNSGLAFSGVIFGKDTNITVTVKKPDSASQYGGLIKYSQGSVVKDLTIIYENETVVTDNIIPGNGNTGSDSTPGGVFFGGVIGYCIGGDTIIDNVNVIFKKSVTATGTYDYLAAIGGYVGMIGGYAETTGRVSKGGGVIFRNMPSTYTGLEAATSKSNYYYYNPYVGRVLDGYAASDTGTTLDNTDKNYQIPTLSDKNTATSLVVQRENSAYTVDVGDAQGLWLLSAIINSGAGCMDWYGYYREQQSDSAISNAYYYGKVRCATYEYMGQAGADAANDATQDEQWWGGKVNVAADKYSRVSYLVSKYASSIDAARVAAYHIGDTYMLTLTGKTYDMSTYGSGFRGVGASYMFNTVVGNTNRTLSLRNINGNNSTITLNMDRKVYAIEEADQNTANSGRLAVVGVGLFPTLNMKDYSSGSSCKVENLNITGTVKKSTFDGTSGTETTTGLQVSAVGGIAGSFSAQSSNDARTVYFTNVTLDKLTVSGSRSAGGILGANGYTNANYNTVRNLIFTDCSYSNLSVTADGAAGGFVGSFRAMDNNTSITIQTTKAISCQGTILSKGVVADTSNQTYIGAGGLVGSMYCTSATENLTVTAPSDKPMTFENVTISQSGTDVISESQGGVGGILGGVSGKTSNTSKISVNNVVLKAVTVQGFQDADSWSGSNRSAGGIIGVVDVTYSDVTLDQIQIIPDSNEIVQIGNAQYCGGLIGRLATNKKTSITNCTVKGSENATVLIYNNNAKQNCYVGGAIGQIAGSGDVVMNAFHLEATKLAAHGDSRLGGVVGQISSAMTLQIANSTLASNTLAGDQDETCVGGIAGELNNAKTRLTGYNLLSKENLIGIQVDETKTGDTNALQFEATDKLVTKNFNIRNLALKDSSYRAYANIKSITDSSWQNANLGVWVGSTVEGATSCLTGVCVTGDYRPGQDIGNVADVATTDSYFIYADYEALENNVSNSVLPSGFSAAAPYVTVNGHTQIGNLLVTGDGANPSVSAGSKSVMYQIINDYNNKMTTGWNLIYNKIGTQIDAFTGKSTKYNYSSNLSSYSASGDNGNLPDGLTDFSVLLIDTNETTAINELVNSYISIVTNHVETTDSHTYSKITAVTYQWDETGKSFVETDTPSMTWRRNRLQIAGGQYDNTKQQFTLLDVQYTNPADESEVVYHLYIPVLVKKVLKFNFYASIMSGTDYYSDDYTDLSTHVIASHGEQITAYLTFQYVREQQEWQDALNNGDNLLENFDKQVWISNDSNEVTLPEGTMLTLVDQNAGGLAYTLEVKSDTLDTNGKLDFTKFTSSVGSGQAWSNLPLCDFLQLKVEQEQTGNFVKTELDSGDATVRVKGDDGNYIYYRLATDKELADNNIEKYAITVEKNSTVEEHYYLTIQTPSSAKDVINNQIKYKESKLSGGGIPTSREKSSDVKNDSENRFIFGNFFSQTMSISTNSDEQLSSVNNTILADLKTTISFAQSEDGKASAADIFRVYATGLEVYQNFVLEMKLYEGTEGSGESVNLPEGSEVRVWYDMIASDGTSILDENSNVPTSRSEANVYKIGASASSYELLYPDRFAAQNIINYISNYGSGGFSLIAHVEITFYDDSLEEFPIRENNNATSRTGISVLAKSNLAFSQSALQNSSISSPLIEDQNAKHYYREKILAADLNYYAFEVDSGDSSGTVSQLGINANELNTSPVPILSMGQYDVSNVENITQATHIEYELQLWQKNNDGKYQQVSASNYLTNVSIADTAVQASGDIYVLQEKWDGSTKDKLDPIEIPVNFSVITGSDFEKANQLYANYKVVLKVKLLHEDKTSQTFDDLDGSSVEDFIVYTNARIATEILKKDQNSQN